MCTVGDDNVEDEVSKYMEATPKLNKKDKLCQKCSTAEAVVVLRGKDTYCKECFIAGTTHKFKGYLGKHRLVRPNDQVLVQYIPGQASTTLLHLLRTGLDIGTYKKLQFVPIIIYVEDRDDLTVEERKETLLKIQEDVCKNNNFATHFVSLVKYSHQINEGVNPEVYSNADLPIEEDTFKNFKTKNLNADSRNVLERNLLLYAAKYLKCKFIFTPEIGVDLASQLLTDVSLGRGDQLPLDVGLVDNRNPDVTIMRPMRLFETKELIFYNVLNNLQTIYVPPRKNSQSKTVHSLLKRFVEGLQINYPATITTIVKTGEKLSLDADNLQKEKCTLCQGPIKKVLDELTSEESTSFSHCASTQLPNNELSGQERYQQLLEGFSKPETNKYCFACRKIKDFIL